MAEEVFLLKEQLKEKEEEIAALKYKLAQLETVRKYHCHTISTPFSCLHVSVNYQCRFYSADRCNVNGRFVAIVPNIAFNCGACNLVENRIASYPAGELHRCPIEGA